MVRKILAGLTLTAFVGALTVAGMPQAFAKKDKHEKEKVQHTRHGDGRHHESKDRGRHFSDGDRVVVHEYYEDNSGEANAPRVLQRRTTAACHRVRRKSGMSESPFRRTSFTTKYLQRSSSSSPRRVPDIGKSGLRAISCLSRSAPPWWWTQFKTSGACRRGRARLTTIGALKRVCGPPGQLLAPRSGISAAIDSSSVRQYQRSRVAAIPVRKSQ